VETLKEAIVVTIKKEGISAYGECVAMSGPWYSDETIASAGHIIKRILAPQLLAKNFSSPSDFLHSTDGIRGNNMAVASVEMALWDLLGKTKSISLSKLLGGTKRDVDVGVSVGIQPTAEKLVEVVKSYLGEGYKRIKLKIEPGCDIDRVTAIRKIFPDIMLQVDANSSYNLEQANILKQLDSLGLLLIEQPLAHDDMLDHAKLQKQLSTPICLDESIHTPEDARKALEIDACRVINIKAGRVRGLQRSKEIHDLCMGMKIPVWCGGMLETGIGRAFNVALASLPGFTLPGDTSASRRYFDRDVIVKEFELTKDGTLEVPDGPGIGVEVDETLLGSCTKSRELLSRA
jgi:O-succinylbenzoate synthase